MSVTDRQTDRQIFSLQMRALTTSRGLNTCSFQSSIWLINAKTKTLKTALCITVLIVQTHAYSADCTVAQSLVLIYGSGLVYSCPSPLAPSIGQVVLSSLQAPVVAAAAAADQCIFQLL